MTDLSHLPLWGQLLLAMDYAVIAWGIAHGIVTYVVGF